MTLTLFVAAIVSVAALLSCANGEGMQLSVEEPGIEHSQLEGYQKGETLFSDLAAGKLFNVLTVFGDVPCWSGKYDNIEGSDGAIRTPRRETTRLTMRRDVNMFGMWIGNLHGEMDVIFLDYNVEIQRFTTKDILRLLDDRYRIRGSKNESVFSCFLNFFCPNKSCRFNQVEIVAISDGIVTNHHTVGLLEKKLMLKNIKKTLGVLDKRLKKDNTKKSEDEKDNEKKIKRK